LYFLQIELIQKKGFKKHHEGLFKRLIHFSI